MHIITPVVSTLYIGSIYKELNTPSADKHCCKLQRL